MLSPLLFLPSVSLTPKASHYCSADKLEAVVENCKELQGEEDVTLANVKKAGNFKELMNAMAGRNPYDDGKKE